MYVDSLTAHTCVATRMLAEHQDTALRHLQAGRGVVNVEAAHLDPWPLRQASSRADTLERRVVQGNVDQLNCRTMNT